MSIRHKDVEEILNNADALDAFKEWIRINPQRSTEALDLYFALKGFKNYLRSSDAALRAQMIHRKYISLKTGTCSFLSVEARQEMSNRIHNLKSNTGVSATLFDPIWQPLMALLRSWFPSFVSSEPYHTFLTNDCDDENEGYSEVLPTNDSFKKESKSRCSDDASTSKAFVDETFQPENKIPEIAYNHEKREHRERFFHEVSTKLQRIADEIARKGGEIYARDISRSSIASFSNREKEKIFDQTISDEEVDKYAERMNRRRSTSESPPAVVSFPSQQSQFPSFAPSVPGYDFNVTIPDRYGTQNRKARTPGFYDTSGFCSSESAYFSSERSYGQRSSGFNDSGFHHGSPFASHTLQRRIPLSQPSSQNVFATLPRKLSQSNQNKVQCRLWREGEVAPYTAILSGPTITLQNFRRTFGIRKNENIRLLFKSYCDDDSAPFQWSLISEDHLTLPLFEGKITAEAKVYVDSD